MSEIFKPLITAALLCALPAMLLASDMVEIEVVSVRDSSGSFSSTKFVQEVDPQREMPGAQIADLIASLPGVSLNGQGGSMQTYSLRGLSRARIQTRLAGIPLTTDRRAGIAASFIDPFLLDRITVVKGAASMLYGSGALGGIVDLTARQFDGFNLTTNHYSNGDQTMAGIGWGNTNWSAGLAIRDHGRSTDTDNELLNDATHRVSSSLTSRHELSATTILSSSIIITTGRDIGKSSADYPARRTTIYPDENHYLAEISIRNDSWSVQVYGHDNELVTDVMKAGAATVTSEASALDYGLHAMKRWQTPDTSYRLGIDLNNRGRVTIKEASQSTGSTTALDARQQMRGVFADAQWQGTDTVLHIGLRFSEVEQSGSGIKRNDQRWTGAIRARRTINSYVDVFGELSSGFRFPKLGETLFSGTTGRGELIGSPDLDPETSVSLELGTFIHGPTWSLNISAYQMNIDDYIERFNIADRLLSYRNVKDGSISGIEFSGELDVTDQLHMTVNGNWLEGEDDQGEYLQDLTPSEVGIMLKHSQPWGSWEAGYQHRFSTSRVHNTEQATDSYDLLSVAANVMVSPQFSVKVWARNLLDDKFLETRDDLSPISMKGGFGISLNWYN